MSERQLEILMAPDTVTTLLGAGFVLYGFRAVRTTNRSARPLVWLSRQRYSARTVLRFGAELRAFTSFDAIRPGRRIVPGFDTEMVAGQTLRIGQGGLGEVVDDPRIPPSIRRAGFGFHQTDTRSIRCGLADPGEGAVIPFCAFDLLPGFAEVVMPIGKVLLMFSDRDLPTGTVVESLFEPDGRPGSALPRLGAGPGLLVDTAASAGRVLRFGIETGWQADGPGARPVLATENLVPLLIETPARNQGQRGGRQHSP